MREAQQGRFDTMDNRTLHARILSTIEAHGRAIRFKWTGCMVVAIECIIMQARGAKLICIQLTDHFRTAPALVVTIKESKQWLVNNTTMFRTSQSIED